MARIVDLFRDTAPSAPYDDVARREAYAQALRQSAARPRGPAPGGRVQAKFGIGEGLTQLAEALLARYAGKQAIEARNAADEQTRVQNEGVINDLTADPRPQKLDQNMQPIAGTEPQQLLDIDTGRPELNARGKALQLALSGMEPQRVQQVLAQQQLSRLLPDEGAVSDRALRKKEIEAASADRREAIAERKAANAATLAYRLENLKQQFRIHESQMANSALDRQQRAEAAKQANDLRLQIATMADETRRAKIDSDRDRAPAVTSESSARSFLDGINYDASSGSDDVSALIQQSTGGAIGTGVDAAARAFNIATGGSKAIAALKSRASEAVLDFLGGRLGTGVSNADRDFMMQRVGDIGNSMLSVDERQAAWNDIVNRMRASAGVGASNSTQSPDVPLTPEEEQELARREQAAMGANK